MEQSGSRCCRCTDCKPLQKCISELSERRRHQNFQKPAAAGASLTSHYLLTYVWTLYYRHIYESSVSQWRMSAVARDCGLRQLVAFYCRGFRRLLDSAASRTAVLQCGTVCHQPCAKTCHCLHLRQNWNRIFFRRSQWLSKTTRRCCGGFAISAPWYKWLYLLTYLLNSQEKSTSIHFLREILISSELIKNLDAK